MSMGLETTESMPQAAYSSSWCCMALAVRPMIGVWRRPPIRSRARMDRVAARPSSTGICTSIRIRSYEPVCI